MKFHNRTDITLYKPQKVKKLALISQLLTAQILTNDVQVLILSLSYLIITVLPHEAPKCFVLVSRSKTKRNKHQKSEKLTLDSQLQTYQILTNDDQMLILCLTYFIINVMVNFFFRVRPVRKKRATSKRSKSISKPKMMKRKMLKNLNRLIRNT